MPGSLEMPESRKYSQIFQRKPNSNLGISEYMFCSCYISQKHSGIQSCQDFNLDEPERIYNICLLTIYEHRLENSKSCYISQKYSGIQ